ncbi:hypothetical protein KSC_001570 [Ktedonobacter sp. SOSP1-52]|uniref:sigma-70 family RNA polymerase sigma factor n=1 Tax=Ktedonobacter sp. SOSP1-52 TaxID=2778366 RepID=UPI0019168F8A|nr:sigma-70 family RNA polymerase sigma factor [Ktedonobacter sp. SOSP1-52]GHO61265.1 hypothetical protein KSC_001570 [Ktedonobacter sp. SOSP1-52]
MDSDDIWVGPTEKLEVKEEKEPYPNPRPSVHPIFSKSDPSLKKIQLLPLVDELPAVSLPAFEAVPMPPSIIKPPPTIFTDLWGEEQEDLASEYSNILQTNILTHTHEIEKRQSKPVIEDALLLPEERYSTPLSLAQDTLVDKLWEYPSEITSEDWTEQATASFDDLGLLEDLDLFDIDAALAKQEAEVQQQEYEQKKEFADNGKRFERWGGSVSLIYVNWENTETAEQEALKRLGCANIPMSKETRDFIIQVARNARLPHRQEIQLTRQLTNNRQKLTSLPPFNEDEVIDPYAAKRQALQDEITEIEHTLTNKMQWVAIKKAARYRGQGIEFDDLIQFGLEGVIAGIRHFDITRSTRLLLSVNTWTFQAITRAIADYGSVIRLPAHMFEQVRVVKKQQHQWEHEHGQPPTDHELATIMDIPLSELVNILRAKDLLSSSHKILSINRLIRTEYLNEGFSFQETEERLHTTDDAFSYIIGEITGRQMQEVLYQDLSSRERLVFSLRAGFNEDGEVSTLEEIGEHLQITRERVRQIEKRTKKKMIYQWEVHFKDLYPDIPIPQEPEKVIAIEGSDPQKMTGMSI